MSTIDDIHGHDAADPEQVRSKVQALLDRLDMSAQSSAEAGSEPDLQAHAQILEQAHDVLVNALESAEQG